MTWLGAAWPFFGGACFWRGVTWCGVVSCGTVRLGSARLGLAWLGLAWLGLAWLGLAWLVGVAWRGVVRMASWLCACVVCGCVLCMCGQWLVALACGVCVHRLWFAFRDPVTVEKQDMIVVPSTHKKSTKHGQTNKKPRSNHKDDQQRLWFFYFDAPNPVPLDSVTLCCWPWLWQWLCVWLCALSWCCGGVVSIQNPSCVRPKRHRV